VVVVERGGEEKKKRLSSSKIESETERSLLLEARDVLVLVDEGEENFDSSTSAKR